ncbi:MAG: NERD domain-containing protein [Anaerolineae bacterium]|nr:NERD domain-containing protein [Anaerolineae bacterium]
MRIETNNELIKRNRRTANILFFFSMGILIAGFLVANLQLTAKDGVTLLISVVAPWIVLPLGFISTLISVRMTNLWVRQPRPEKAIPAGLKGLSKRSVLYNYYHFPARHVLVAPQGVFAIVTRYQDGRYIVNGEKWQSPGGPFAAIGRFFRRDAIGDPTADAHKAAAYVKGLIEKTLPNVEVQPLIIFVDPKARLEINDSSVPVLYSDENKEPNLRDFIRQLTQKQTPQIEQPAAKKGSGGKGKGETKPELGVINPEQVADALEEATVIG